ncbi:MAG: MarR family winged helix-turn-helix transcriptional regulator [Thermodesulfobacteriota bacterium]|jgi:DNA-binding MarR family transcriptional regulator
MQKTKAAMDLEAISHLLIGFYEKISSWEQAVVRGTGLSPAQMHAIEIIGQEKSLRMKELADHLGVTTGSLTVMVDRLEQNGFLERRPHETDRRSFLVTLTDKGRKHFKKHHRLHLKLTEDVLAALDPAEQQRFAEALEMISKRI